MDDAYPEHDIFRGQNLLTSAANLLSKYASYQLIMHSLHVGRSFMNPSFSLNLH